LPTFMVISRPLHPNRCLLNCVILTLILTNTACCAVKVPKQARFCSQPLVTFSNWHVTKPFSILDVQDHSALIAVEIKQVSATAKGLESYLPVYRVERWHLPDLIWQGTGNTIVRLGELIAGRLAGDENFLFYRDRLVISDTTLKDLELTYYPTLLEDRLGRGTPAIGVAAGGDYVMIDDHLWDHRNGKWHTDKQWHLISPEIVMGSHFTAAIGSYPSGKVWLIPYQNPERAITFPSPEFQQLFLSPDEKSLLIGERNGHYRFIDVERQTELEDWKTQSGYAWANWRYNRLLTISRGGNWSLHQIAPHREVAHGSMAKNGFAIISTHQPVGILFDPEQNKVEFVQLTDGAPMGEQHLPELADSYAWLDQKVPLAYSQEPLTVLLPVQETRQGIPQFKPYRLQMDACDNVSF